MPNKQFFMARFPGDVKQKLVRSAETLGISQSAMLDLLISSANEADIPTKGETEMRRSGYTIAPHNKSRLVELSEKTGQSGSKILCFLISNYQGISITNASDEV